MQEVAADKGWVAAMGFVYALVVVTEDVELAIDEASVRPGEIGERFFLSGPLDVSSGALGEGLGLLCSSSYRDWGWKPARLQCALAPPTNPVTTPPIYKNGEVVWGP